MKQHITKEQWDELSEEQEEKMRRFMWKDYAEVGKPISGYLIAQEEGVYMGERLPNIGQMIMFLGEDRHYMIEIGRSGPCIISGSDPIFADELTDALWEACKNKLNQTKDE